MLSASSRFSFHCHASIQCFTEEHRRSQHLMPNAKEAGARNIMMPGVKTRSGGKAMAKKARTARNIVLGRPHSNYLPLLLLHLFYRPLSRFDPNLIAPTPIDEHVTPALVARALHADGITWEDFAG
ncbi:hypothetical protein B0H17DRAFT_1201306 [Mycena rosella]|uniref:Uncharacterized protein n=1 Tax=Mycena rosella TaxID=1033263 RepID=A0AAD7DGQ4_MYCRO|nr:hypothetical protein B0H17DRAFT_1201306 [Mycena rosella]